MTIEDDLSPAFQSFQGFHRLVHPGHPMARELDQLLDLSLRDDHGFAVAGCDSIRLLDTFYGFPGEVFREAVKQLAKEDGPEFRIDILVANPHSQLARARAQALAEVTPDISEDPFYETSKRLHNLVCSIGDSTGRDLREGLLLPKADDDDPAKTFGTLLRTFRAAATGLPIRIKFYDRPTEAPVYIISEFILKGLLLDHVGASSNPWMVFVNDQSQPDDMFDRLSGNFDTLWRTAATHPRAYRVQGQKPDVTRMAFIIMPMDEDDSHLAEVHGVIRSLWKEKGIAANRSDDVHTTEKRITEVMMNSLTTADYAVCDLSLDRPNVYYEAGFAQALGKPVIFIAQEGTNVHFDLRDYPITYFKDLVDLETKLRKRIDRLLARRTLESGELDGLPKPAETAIIDLTESDAPNVLTEPAPAPRGAEN